MKKLWCWRCNKEVPMMDEDEYLTVHKLYIEGAKSWQSGMSREISFKPMLDYYNKLGGFEETEANVIMHHRLNEYGPACESCGKPYRTTMATFCAACGHKRQ